MLTSSHVFFPFLHSGRTVRDCLILTLVGLNDCEFKKFKDKLNKFHVRKGLDNFPKELLQSANVQKLTNLLLKCYKEDYAVQVTAAVLEAACLKPHAEKLLALSRIKHFVEMHQEELIRQVCGMDVILFRLLGWILKADEYRNIMAEESDAGKMKMLLKLVPNWTTRKKDHLYQELVQTNGPLIAALKGK
uniref:Pyrin domain-containing protein n=1 Tax=Varanus komodoensis TaxID=61221 RepID=A0A8D2LNI3_VARKO